MFRSPLFSWSPRSDQDPFATPASQSPSRFGAFQGNIRTIINGSSVYSQSPALGPSNNNTPKMAFRNFSGRNQQSPDPNPNPQRTSHDVLHEPTDSTSPLHAQHTAGSYIHTIAPLQDPQEPTTIFSRHPADVPLPYQYPEGPLSSEEEHIVDDIDGRKRQRKHKKRKHRRPGHWVRRRDERGTRGVMRFTKGTAAREKMVACLISGSFLVTVLAIYLAIALSNRNLGEEIHVLFIITLLFITIFFCHSLIRLCMLMLNPPRETPRPRMPAMTAPEGFRPIVPIRVHLVRDEEGGPTGARDMIENEADVGDLEKNILAPPPPAYGLWRSSVRADPNLLHWQRTENQNIPTSVAPHSRDIAHSGTLSGPTPIQARSTPDGPRPPSYASEDGVSYIVDAAPRSTVNNRQSNTGVSDIHPAWRPGYAMSAIRGDEPGWSNGRGAHGII